MIHTALRLFHINLGKNFLCNVHGDYYFKLYELFTYRVRIFVEFFSHEWHMNQFHLFHRKRLPIPLLFFSSIKIIDFGKLFTYIAQKRAGLLFLDVEMEHSTHSSVEIHPTTLL